MTRWVTARPARLHSARTANGSGATPVAGTLMVSRTTWAMYVNGSQSWVPGEPLRYLRSWGPRRLADLRDWCQQVVLLPLDEAVSLVWGELQARAQRRGRPRAVNDTWVAACCLVYG